MRIANIEGRAALVLDHEPDGAFTAIDIADATGGRLPSDLPALYSRWDELVSWASGPIEAQPRAFSRSALRAPSPAPRQIVALGLNYRDHATEAGFGMPEGLPPVFSKFVSSITGPASIVELPEGNVDWEIELAVVIGREAHHIEAHEAWSHVAGVTVAQDLSERVLQMAGPAPQFGLAKSHPGFLPLGPWLVSAEELSDRDNVSLHASVNGETVQQDSTASLIVPIDQMIAQLSQIITLYPGDVILTGTPSGVGMSRRPPRYLEPGDELVSTIEGVGSIHQGFVARSG